MRLCPHHAFQTNPRPPTHPPSHTPTQPPTHTPACRAAGRRCARAAAATPGTRCPAPAAHPCRCRSSCRQAGGQWAVIVGSQLTASKQPASRTPVVARRHLGLPSPGGMAASPPCLPRPSLRSASALNHELQPACVRACLPPPGVDGEYHQLARGSLQDCLQVLQALHLQHPAPLQAGRHRRQQRLLLLLPLPL